jgi:hypothetical protein
MRARRSAMRVKLVLSTMAKAGTTGICVWLLLLLGLLSSGDLYAASKGPEITTKGYSIFDGTMVDMTYPEIEKAAQEKAIVLFPTGVIEEHGPHLPLGVDTYEAYIKAKLLKAELEKKGIRALIAPPFYHCRVRRFFHHERGNNDQRIVGCSGKS